MTVPYLIETKQVQLEAKHTNFIQFILAVLLISIFLIVLACAVKYNRTLESTFNQLQAALEKAKSGYNKDKKAAI